MSGVLELNRKSTVAFDPANKEHRKWYSCYLRDGNWVGVPVQFIVTENPRAPLPVAIETLLIDYYIAREFKYKSK